jgi:succinate dehydrogenase/fumarate reductase cytochrome b subunit
MSNFAKTFSSSLGKKLVMALTGLFLCTFLIVHLVGNLQLFKDDAGQAFNAYAYFMTHFTPNQGGFLFVVCLYYYPCPLCFDHKHRK